MVWRLSSSTILLRRVQQTITHKYNYEVLLQQRGQISNAGMYTFPGGVYEDCDKNLKITALRELFEEAGVLFYPSNNFPRFTDTQLSEWRQVIRSDPSKFQELLSSLNFNSQDQPHNFFHHCSFITPNFEKRRYTTLFFITEMSFEDSLQLQPDGTETSSLLWIHPSQAMIANQNKQMSFLPPQYYILSELNRHQTIEDIFSHLKEVQQSKSLSSEYLPETAYDLIDCRGYPAIKPSQLLLTPSQMVLTLPFDESHPEYPGQPGHLHRIQCTLPMGEGGFKLQKTI